MPEPVLTFAHDVYKSAVPLLLAGLGWLLVRFGKAALRRLDAIADLPEAVERLADELAATRDDHEERITHLETHLTNGATP